MGCLLPLHLKILSLRDSLKEWEMKKCIHRIAKKAFLLLRVNYFFRKCNGALISAEKKNCRDSFFCPTILQYSPESNASGQFRKRGGGEGPCVRT